MDVPHAARIWNYWMGGKDNYEVDRAAGDADNDPLVLVHARALLVNTNPRGGDELRSIVARVMAAVPSGSYLALWDGTDTRAAVIEGGVKLVESGAIPYNLRSPEQVG
ncbi:MAG: SAM-dependent methyltransferase [Pseudonocardiaceae bacterium]